MLFRSLLGRLASSLAEGGQVAIQVPANHDYPSHTVAEEVAAEQPLVYRPLSMLAIASVVAGSPAAQAGLRRGDIVVSVDGKNIVTATAIQQLMVEDAIARRIEMTVWRNGALVDVFVVPRELADPV